MADIDIRQLSGAFSFFLPIKLYQPEQDLRRLTQINLRSLERFFDRELLEKVVIAARAKDVPLIQDAVSKSGISLPVEVIPETKLLPNLARLGGMGWFRQQVLKIFAWRVIDSPYVILLDDDVLMTRPTGRDELVMGGRLVMSHLHADGFRQYFDSSCPLLGYDRDAVSPEQRVMNVTPEVMVTAELRNLVGELRQLWNLRSDDAVCEFLLRVSKDYCLPQPTDLWGRLWRKARARLFPASDAVWRQRRDVFMHWTEYTLYWVYLLKVERTGHYYDYNADEHARQLNDEGIWFEDQARQLGIDDWLERTFCVGHQHCFAVYSARVESLDREELYTKLQDRLW
ncbi:MAG: hypothetical protein RLZZ536_3664 [Planctomycetota bacterium]